MLVELMAANAAFAVIKQTLCNGKDLVDAGKSVGVYFKAENDIAKEVEAKGRASALEAYQAQQQLRKQEAELKEMLNKQGLMGYHNFLEFKAQFARDKKEAAKIRAKKKHQRAAAFEEALTLGIKVMLGLLITVAALFGAAIYLR
jgi:hypothetical protein